MRFNEKELRLYAKKMIVDKEGRLAHKHPRESSFKNRLFKLKNNLLFYYRTNDQGVAEVDPLGMIVVERCRVQLEEVEGCLFAFTIEFPEEDRKHIFSGSNQEQCTEWVAVLQRANCEYWQKRIKSLKMQIYKRTGRDPVKDFERSQEWPPSPNKPKRYTKHSPSSAYRPVHTTQHNQHTTQHNQHTTQHNQHTSGQHLESRDRSSSATFWTDLQSPNTAEKEPKMKDLNSALIDLSFDGGKQKSMKGFLMSEPKNTSETHVSKSTFWDTQPHGSLPVNVDPFSSISHGNTQTRPGAWKPSTALQGNTQPFAGSSLGFDDNFTCQTTSNYGKTQTIQKTTNTQPLASSGFEDNFIGLPFPSEQGRNPRKEDQVQYNSSGFEDNFIVKTNPGQGQSGKQDTNKTSKDADVLKLLDFG